VLAVSDWKSDRFLSGTGSAVTVMGIMGGMRIMG